MLLQERKFNRFGDSALKVELAPQGAAIYAAQQAAAQQAAQQAAAMKAAQQALVSRVWPEASPWPTIEPSIVVPEGRGTGTLVGTGSGTVIRPTSATSGSLLTEKGIGDFVTGLVNDRLASYSGEVRMGLAAQAAQATQALQAAQAAQASADQANAAVANFQAQLATLSGSEASDLASIQAAQTSIAAAQASIDATKWMKPALMAAGALALLAYFKK
jgi:hypothetical protein